MHRRPAPSLSALAVLALLVSAPAGARAETWGECPEAIGALADRADRITRGDSSHGMMSMEIFKRGTTSMRLETWSEGREKFLVKVRQPSRLRGMATLKSGDNLWNYLPRSDRIVKLGSSMMGDAWMGSHFTNDDLVKETLLREHYRCIDHRAEDGDVVITAEPRPDAPVVWGKVVMKVVEETAIPVWTRYYDERASWSGPSPSRTSGRWTAAACPRG